MNHEHFEHGEHPGDCEHTHEPKQITDHLGITVTHHEGAVICSMERIIAKDYEQVRDILTSELKTLADWVEDQGGIVGHIKAFLTVQGHSCMLSTVGGDVQVKETLIKKVTVKIAVIVFIEKDNLLSTKLDELLERLCSQ